MNIYKSLSMNNIFALDESIICLSFTLNVFTDILKVLIFIEFFQEPWFPEFLSIGRILKG
jgi:hypothetical protein